MLIMANFGSHVDSGTGLEHESYVYDPQLYSLVMLTISLFLYLAITKRLSFHLQNIPTCTIDFIGYLSLSSPPILFPLYVSISIPFRFILHVLK
jgi:hypothetical protein